MGRPTKGVEIRIGDKSKARFLRYSHEAFARIEEATGSTFDQHVKKGCQSSVLSIQWLLWAGLIHDEPDLEIQDVREMLHSQDYEAYLLAVLEARNSAVPDSARMKVPAKPTGETPEGNVPEDPAQSS